MFLKYVSYLWPELAEKGEGARWEGGWCVSAYARKSHFKQTSQEIHWLYNNSQKKKKKKEKAEVFLKL